MSKKIKFSVKNEEKIINFVKLNEILYNKKNRRFRDIETKNNLWLQLANELAVDVDVVKRKWKVMRDYFFRTRKKKTTGSEESPLSRRDEALSFLLHTSKNIENKSSLSSLVTAVEPSTNLETQSQFDSLDTNSNADDLSCVDDSDLLVSFPQTPKSRIISVSSIDALETNEIQRECLPLRPKPSDFKPQIPNDDIQQFFDSMASTVRKFSPISIVRIKNKIAEIVGEEEIAWAEKAFEFRLECRRAQTLLRKSFARNETRTQKTRKHKQASDNSIENFFNDNNAEPKNSTPSPTTGTDVNDKVDPEVEAAATDEPFESVKIKAGIDISTNYNLRHKEPLELDADEANESSDEDDNKSIETFDTRLTSSDPSDDDDWSEEYIKTAKKTKTSLNGERVSNKTDHRNGEKSETTNISSTTTPHINLSNDTKIPKYICEMCGQTFELMCRFRIHVNRHRGEQTFACEICPDKFYTQLSLTRHMLKHAGAKPYSCSYCPRRFLDYSAKHRHERIHTNERSYKCIYCDKAFTRNYILKSHVLTHIGEPSFSCDICQRSFIQKKSLMSHCKTAAHKQKEEEYEKSNM